VSSRRRWLYALGALLAMPFVAHGATIGCTRMSPPAIERALDEVTIASDDPSRRELGQSWARRRGEINEVRLVGSPEAIGYANVRLLYDQQVAIERELHDQFAEFVPWSPVRALVVDVARLRFRSLDRSLSPSYRREVAAQALAFHPDPFDGLMDTYQRFVFLHSLYDIMLSFERSPLIGCTSFVVGSVEEGEPILVGRNFDFEGPAVLDAHKAVYLVFEEGGAIPYASVSWPGFIGATSGMNREGVTVVIHGARAGEVRTNGAPVVQTVREVLARAHTTREALRVIAAHDPMVPHMLLVTDALGDAVAIERIPGQPPHVRTRQGRVLPLTNHLEGPAADDPKNRHVETNTSTLARRARLDELLTSLPSHVQPADAMRILRDKQAAGGEALPLGHRHAIDALIATHSLVMDVTSRVLWVSEGPHAMGRFLRFDLRELLRPDYRPTGPASVESLPSDDIAEDGRYDQWVRDGSTHPSVGASE
jgi:isopenicillin-N N-acyltransferase like protein